MDILFRDLRHENDFYNFIEEDNMRHTDNERIALFYLLALNDDTAANIQKLYDFKNHWINVEGLEEPFQSSGSIAVTRLAFNLYNGHVDVNTKGICQTTPENIFYHGEFFEYFVESLRLRFNQK